MNAFKKAGLVLGAMGLALSMSQSSYAQMNSNNATVTLNATLAEQITIVAAPTTVTFALAPTGITTGSAPVGVTTTWALAKTRTTMKVYAYFSSGSALTDGGPGDIIPTSSVLGQIGGVGAFNPFTGGSGPFGVNSLQVFAPVIGAGTYGGTNTTNLALEISTTGLNLPAATYTGTLNIQAQAN